MLHYLGIQTPYAVETQEIPTLVQVVATRGRKKDCYCTIARGGHIARNPGLLEFNSQDSITHNAAYQSDGLDALLSIVLNQPTQPRLLHGHSLKEWSDALNESNDGSQTEMIYRDRHIIPYLSN
ncbi:hypothetical protein Tco_0833173 [Tanacetum coccineum]